MLWIQYTNFLLYNNAQITHILYEMYYCYPHVMYINITKNQHKELINHFKKGLYADKNTFLSGYSHCDVHVLQLIHRFEKVGNSYFYTNNCCQDLTIHKSTLSINSNCSILSLRPW